MAKTTSLTEESRTARLRLEQLVVFSTLGEKVGGGGGCGTDGTGLMSKACFCFLFFLFWSELLSCFVLVHLHSGLSGGWTE